MKHEKDKKSKILCRYAYEYNAAMVVMVLGAGATIGTVVHVFTYKSLTPWALLRRFLTIFQVLRLQIVVMTCNVGKKQLGVAQ